MPEERLQKIIAAAGIASRRKAEELITEGRVTLNGEVVTALGTKADPDRDHVRVDGKLLQGAQRPLYLMMYKPKGMVTTASDPEGRPTVMDLVKGISTRVYPVGRLDYMSEGLLLMTNDGELAQTLTHAASHVPKTYLVKVNGQVPEADLEKLRGGVKLPPEPTPSTWEEGERRRSEPVETGPSRIDLFRDAPNPWYQVTLIEGRNRQIRRMFEHVGHRVEKIKRVRYGPLELDVEPGMVRVLRPDEVAKLKRAAKTRDWDYKIGNEFGVKRLVSKRKPPVPERQRTPDEQQRPKSRFDTRQAQPGFSRPRRDRDKPAFGERPRPRKETALVEEARGRDERADDRRPSAKRFGGPKRDERSPRGQRPAFGGPKREERTDGQRPSAKRYGGTKRDERGPRGERPAFGGPKRSDRQEFSRGPQKDRRDRREKPSGEGRDRTDRGAMRDWARGAGPTGPRDRGKSNQFDRDKTVNERARPSVGDKNLRGRGTRDEDSRSRRGTRPPGRRDRGPRRDR
jgi:23S rRNA pseudouridine2605 synthase